MLTEKHPCWIVEARGDDNEIVAEDYIYAPSETRAVSAFRAKYKEACHPGIICLVRESLIKRRRYEDAAG